MEHKEFTDILNRVFAENSKQELIAGDASEKLCELTDIMLEKNKVMNLTAITEPYDIALKHYLDSLTASDYITQNSKIIDVGCGAGFPSLPLAIVRPDLQITALDSTAKRIGYINETAQKLGLANIGGVCARAEEYVSGCREKYDTAIARAVAPLNVLCEFCLPYIRTGGTFIAMKGPGADDEVKTAAKAISVLGGELDSVNRIILHGSYKELLDPPETLVRNVLLIRKIRKTPDNFPRNYSAISKKPL